MNPYLIIGLGVAWLVSCGGAFWFGSSYREGQQAKQEVLLDKAAEKFTAATQKFTDDLGLTIATEFASIKIVNRNITTEVRHEHEIQTRVLDNPDCVVPSSTVKLLNRARSDAGQNGSSAGGVEGRLRDDGAVEGSAPGR